MEISIKTTAPIPMTDWFQAAGDPAIIGRVVHVKRINETESKKQRKPVFVTLPAIEHKAAGLAGDVSFALIKEEADPDNAEYWIRRFPSAWAAYKGSEAEVPQGTPLDEFDELPAHKIAEFKLHGMTSVEQLAALTDANIAAIGAGARKWKQSADKFLKRRANSGHGYNTQG